MSLVGITDLDELRGLLENGANVNAKDLFGRTALMRASINGYPEICKLLISKVVSDF